MKKMKRLAALFLAVVMIMAMGMTAAAAEITINNPQEVVEGQNKTDATYEAFKIFSLTKSEPDADGKVSYSYKLDEDSAAYEQLSSKITGEAKSYTGNGFYIEKTTVDGVYNANVTNAPEFAAYLKTLNLTGGISGVKDGDKVKINIGDNIGYYFVSTNSGALADLTTANDQLEIYDKNEKPQITKTADDESVEIGQIVTYTIRGTVPSTVGYTTYKYVIADEMSGGLDFMDDVTNTLDSTVTAKKVGNGFTLEFDMAAKKADGSNKYTTGTEFTVTYSARVNANAITSNNETNKATLEYSNDPTDSTKTDKNPAEQVEVYTASVIINKYDGKSTAEDADAKLKDAKFVLSRVAKVDGRDVTQYYKYTKPVAADPDNGVAAVLAKVEWVSDIKDATEVITDQNGAAQFNGLEDGTYNLIETAAPAGYNLLKESVTVEVKGTAATETVEAVKKNHTEDVANSAGVQLPSTGGIGTTIFYVVGGILVLGAGVLLITKKRMSARN